GQIVEHGQLIGRVGSTGLSTGNHLHWDLLAGGTQIDGLTWLESDFGCWLLEGIGNACGQDSDLQAIVDFLDLSPPDGKRQ
ncbi:MAG TPA: M23 family metallopeptidase, partial [candidate division Zixibacteria bacterium]|nr:M23 family metallopeptidase [candidate division Zixibacteria bacterium]